MKTGWTKKRFEDCIEGVTYTRKILRKNFLEAGRYPIVSQEAEFINGYWNNESDVFHIETPVVVFGDHTQVLKYVDFDFVIGADGVKILRPRSFLIPKFFYYQLRATSLESLGYARHYRLLKEIEIGYPETGEQRRIVSSLDQVFATVAVVRSKVERKLSDLSELQASVLDETFKAVRQKEG